MHVVIIILLIFNTAYLLFVIIMVVIMLVCMQGLQRLHTHTATLDYGLWIIAATVIRLTNHIIYAVT